MRQVLEVLIISGYSLPIAAIEVGNLLTISRRIDIKGITELSIEAQKLCRRNYNACIHVATKITNTSTKQNSYTNLIKINYTVHLEDIPTHKCALVSW